MPESMPRNRWRCGGWGVVLALASSSLLPAAETDLQRLQALVTDLVAVRQAAHDAETSWAEQRPAVEGRIEVLRQQVAEAEAALAKAQQEASAAAGARQALESDAQRTREALAALAAPTRDAEARLRGLLPRLPEPLTKSLAERIRELPPADTPITAENLQDRLRLVFGLLTEIDQFADGVYLFRQPLTDPQNVQLEMDTIYLGLSMAFAVSGDGASAAAGLPGTGGWVWRWDPALAGPVRTAVAIYRKEQPAIFVTLPLEAAPKGTGGTP